MSSVLGIMGKDEQMHDLNNLNIRISELHKRGRTLNWHKKQEKMAETIQLI
jgi:hypothetical protein